MRLACLDMKQKQNETYNNFGMYERGNGQA